MLKGYPRLSETFIAQEIRALELRGFELCIVSLRQPYDPATHPIHDEIEARVLYLPEYARDEIARVLRALLWCLPRRGFWRALAAFVRDWRRDPTANRARRLAQALVMARELPKSVRHYYTHFMHTPASVSRYASLISGCSWSLSAHAKDIWTLPEWELREKLASAQWAVTCTRANHEYLASLAPASDRVALLYHGLDFDRIAPQPAADSGRDGGDPAAPVRLLSVGRAVDKKGYALLLDALAALPDGLHWRFAHIGRGELLDSLRRRARDLGIDDRVEWLGARAQRDVFSRYRASDLFVLPSRVSADGDRDGLPNVLMEAQSQGLACLSTRLSGIPELIRHDETGYLVPPDDPAALRDALERLVREPALRARLARAGQACVTREFSMQRGIDSLTARLEGTPGLARAT